MPAFKGFEPLSDQVLLGALARYWPCLLAEVVVSVLVARSVVSAGHERFRLRSGRGLSQSALLCLPLLLWCWLARPGWIVARDPFVIGKIAAYWSYWISWYQAVLSLCVLLAVRTLTLTALGRPAWSAGLTGMWRVGTEVAMLTVLLSNFVVLVMLT